MKSERRRDLLRILHEGRASTQQDFVAALRAAGHVVTQATVSRDLNELGAVKVRVGDHFAYRFADDVPRSSAAEVAMESLMRDLEQLAIEIRAAGSLITVITLPGHAAALARAIDLAAVEGVYGTIAGDDTIFAATPDNATAERIAASWLEPANATHAPETTHV